MNLTSYSVRLLSCTLVLPPQLLYLQPEGIVLFDLPRQKMSRELGFGGDSLWRKEVGVASLVGAVAKILNLHETLAE